MKTPMDYHTEKTISLVLMSPDYPASGLQEITSKYPQVFHGLINYSYSWISVANPLIMRYLFATRMRISL
jgi:hypothetical protein